MVDEAWKEVKIVEIDRRLDQKQMLEKSINWLWHIWMGIDENKIQVFKKKASINFNWEAEWSIVYVKLFIVW